jgi:hypothetical protein
MSYFGKYGFGVYLCALDHAIFVSYSHYFSFLGLGSDLEAGRQRFRFDNQRMITGCGEGILYTFIDSFAIVIDERCLAVDRHRSPSHDAAIDMADALVPKTDTEDGYSTAEVKYDVVGNAGFQRCTWARRNDYMTGSQFFDFSQSYFIIAIDQRLPAQLAQVLSQVVDERVVVVDDKYHVIFIFTLTLALSRRGRGNNLRVFTLTLALSLSPYPSGSKSSLDACPPFHPQGRGDKNKIKD